MNFRAHFSADHFAPFVDAAELEEAAAVSFFGDKSSAFLNGASNAGRYLEAMMHAWSGRVLAQCPVGIFNTKL